MSLSLQLTKKPSATKSLWACLWGDRINGARTRTRLNESRKSVSTAVLPWGWGWGGAALCLCALAAVWVWRRGALGLGPPPALPFRSAHPLCTHTTVGMAVG